MDFDPTRAGVELPDEALLKKFDVPAPRYTSYPTADRFHGRITPEDYQAALARREKAAKPAKLSLTATFRFATTFAFTAAATRSSRAIIRALPPTSRRS